MADILYNPSGVKIEAPDGTTAALEAMIPPPEEHEQQQQQQQQQQREYTEPNGPLSGPDTEPPLEGVHLKNLSLAAQAIHADDFLNTHQAVAPPMHVSTTFRYNHDPDKLVYWENLNPLNPHDSHMYSRDSAPNTTRLEAILTAILHGPALTYSSGLAAFHAMLVYLNPRRIAIDEGYHGCHGVIALVSKLTGLQKIDLDCPDTELQRGDIIHVETPLNPMGEARNLAYYAAKARRVGAYLTVDATLGPPPLQDPFLWGADVVMHSGTKYIGGHSDLLCGVLAVAPQHARAGWVEKMRGERLLLGCVMGSLESWLGTRSVRTLELRVRKQSADAEMLVRWLAGAIAEGGEGARGDGKDGTTTGVVVVVAVKQMVREVRHGSLQKTRDDGYEDKEWLKKQMPNGFGPVFAMLLHREADAKRLPSKLRLFHHATSLGGVESLIEWRAMTDPAVDKRLVRISVGIEGWEDLRDDLIAAFRQLAEDES